MARWIWYAYLAWFAFALLAGVMGPLVTPLVASIALVPAALLFAIAAWPIARRLALATLGASIGHLALAHLLLGGPGTRWSQGTHTWVNPPGVPRALRLPAFVVAVLLPPALAWLAIRAMRAAGRGAGSHHRVGG